MGVQWWCCCGVGSLDGFDCVFVVFGVIHGCWVLPLALGAGTYRYVRINSCQVQSLVAYGAHPPAKKDF